MAVPPDFDRSLWLDPLAFQGLIGATLANNKIQYRDLFRSDGFAKPISELRANRHIAKLIDDMEAANASPSPTLPKATQGSM